MKTPAATLDRIADAAVERLCAEGFESLTVGSVAKAARVSTALVHYHFATKQRLLAGAAERLAIARTVRRMAPLRSAGLAALDALWDALSAEVESGAERAWHGIVHLGLGDAAVQGSVERQRAADAAQLAAQLPALLQSLGATGRMPEEIGAVVASLLDGLALQLLGGAKASAVRSAYDAFWLVLIASVQRAPR